MKFSKYLMCKGIYTSQGIFYVLLSGFIALFMKEEFYNGLEALGIFLILFTGSFVIASYLNWREYIQESKGGGN